RVNAIITIFFFQAEGGIRDLTVTGVQTCALPISAAVDRARRSGRRARHRWRVFPRAPLRTPARLAVPAPRRRRRAHEEDRDRDQIGRASCREREWNSGRRVYLTKNIETWSHQQEQ